MKQHHNIKEIDFGFQCSKKWTELDGGEAKRHCSTCDKFVFDFSNQTTEEIIEFLSKRIKTKTCCKINKDQLNQINNELIGLNKVSSFKTLLIAAALTTIIACGPTRNMHQHSYQKEETRFEILSNNINPDSLNTTLTRGQIVDSDQEALIGVCLFTENPDTGTFTDFDGKFELKLTNSEITSGNISIQYTGYEEFKIRLVDIKNKEIKIVYQESEVFIGEIVITKQPVHKRLWNGIKNIFR